ncbi:MAG: exodeoxyribonuclease VII large subunit [Ruminococcus sp.]|nr:exodeoxyribonuclease VII large subunit [Ruminococcus sp.]
MSSVLTVSQINTYLKSIIDADYNLKNIYVSGEISNFTNHYRTGHFYFTLKDERAAIKAVMFRSAAERVRFQIENGMRVVIRGNISVFERDGVYQLYAEDIAPDGIGALNLAYEQLKKKLFSMGMFDEEHKKPIPQFPECIGVITSPTGAAVQDIMNVLGRRYPYAKIILEPVQVQGDSAAGQITAAIEKFNLLHAADVLIVGRGGGSIEDLWAFNEEAVAYAIFESKIPIISAVGHETDFTIADFVSDLRAPTPSAAAELAVPDFRELLYTLDKMLDSMHDAVERTISGYEYELLSSVKVLEALSPQKKIELDLSQVEYYQTMLTSLMERRFEQYQSVLQSQAIKLEYASPLKIIARGYSVATDADGNTVESIKQVESGDSIKLRVSDGCIGAVVDNIIETV